MCELITVEIGQAGLQLSNAIWELFCMEHGVRSNGNRISSLELDQDQSIKTVFNALPNNRYVPRSIKIDLEPTVIDEIKSGAYRNLFSPNSFINGKEDASSNYARGHHTQGSLYISKVMKSIRRFSEQCDSLTGFAIFNSYDGGTGSGFTTRISEELIDTFGKTIQFQIGIFPSTKMSCSTVYPYNSVLHAANTMDSMEICTIVENSSLYEICESQLQLSKPLFSHLNRLIAQVFSNFTVSTRFQTSINTNFNQIMTNLIPYPKIHYLISSFAPICNQLSYESSTDNATTLTRDAFSSENQFSSNHSQFDQYMACLVQYRGDFMPTHINQALKMIKCDSNIEFVNWCPTGFKVGVCSQPPSSPPGSLLPQSRRCVTLFKNNSMITTSWNNTLLKYDHLFSRRAFFQWFVSEGLEEAEFTDSREKIVNLINDYLEICDLKDIDTTNSSDKAGNAHKMVSNNCKIDTVSDEYSNYSVTYRDTDIVEDIF